MEKNEESGVAVTILFQTGFLCTIFLLLWRAIGVKYHTDHHGDMVLP